MSTSVRHQGIRPVTERRTSTSRIRSARSESTLAEGMVLNSQGKPIILLPAIQVEIVAGLREVADERFKGFHSPHYPTGRCSSRTC